MGNNQYTEATMNSAAERAVQTAVPIKRWHKIAAGALPFALIAGACSIGGDSDPATTTEAIDKLGDVTTEAPMASTTPPPIMTT